MNPTYRQLLAAFAEAERREAAADAWRQYRSAPGGTLSERDLVKARLEECEQRLDTPIRWEHL